MDFSTTRLARFELSAAELRSAGTRPTLKLGLEPSLREHLYLGRVSKDGVSLVLSVPRTARRFCFELYDEQGSLLSGERALLEVVQ